MVSTPAARTKALVIAMAFSAVFLFFLVTKRFRALTTPAPSATARIAPELISPVTSRSVHSPQPSAPAVRNTPAEKLAARPTEPPDFTSMGLRPLGARRRYLYTFQGIATYNKAPCPQASVLVRVNAGTEAQTIGGITAEDGSYSLQVPVLAAVNEPVDWIIEAHTPDFKKVELVGRRIVTEQENESAPVTLPGPLALLAPITLQPVLPATIFSQVPVQLI